MAIYTLITTGLNGHQHTVAVDFPNDAEVLAGAKNAVSAEHPTIAVARRRGDELEFLGIYERDEGGGVLWTPNDDA
jgi:hypothetical protein